MFYVKKQNCILYFSIVTLAMLLYFLFTSLTIKSSFTSKKPTLTFNDSLKLVAFIKKLQQSYFEIDTISSLTQNQIDSISSEQRTSIGMNASYIYSPDSVFKIFVVENESCGAYCNPFWESYIEICETGKEIYQDYSFANIYDIALLPDGKYLILEKSYGRPISVYTVSNLTAKLISLNNGKITFHPTINSNTSEKKSIYSMPFTVTQKHFIPNNNMYLNYDATSQKLSYCYAEDIPTATDTAYTFEGFFKYESGTFIHKKETKTFLSIESK